MNHLYYDGEFIAELFFWKGVSIKAGTYNYNGVMVDMYKDRSIDIAEQAFHDYKFKSNWYVDKNDFNYS